MNISISIPDEIVSKPTIDELLAPVRDDFAKSGMTEEELMVLGRTELAVLRQEKASRDTEGLSPRIENRTRPGERPKNCSRD